MDFLPSCGGRLDALADRDQVPGREPHAVPPPRQLRPARVAVLEALVPALDEPTEPDNFTHAAIYEIEGSAADAMAALDAAVTSGRMNLPGWFGQIRFSSWHAAPLGPLVREKA